MDGLSVSGWVIAHPSNLFDVLGFEEGVHYEVVVTTFNEDGSPHASAMGCRVVSRSLAFLLKPHVESQTARNILRTGRGAVNIASPEYIVEAALDLSVVPMSFGLGEVLGVPVLCEASAVSEFLVDEVVRGDVWLQVRASPQSLKYRPAPARPYSRSAALLVEAAVRLSRVEPFLGMNRRDEALRLLSEARVFIEDSARLAGGGRLGQLVGAVRERLYSLERKIPP
ncbi:hypothetical protein HRbin02_00755 [Candidatus Calditenuaceae archaeon HR02]|nr:hypothetical protein HRbin02_00755 [Candidatus Calditenuaceae archaeon HR02]